MPHPCSTCWLKSAFEQDAWREKSVDHVEVLLILCEVVYTRPRVKGDGEMHSPRIGSFLRSPLFVAIAILVIPAISLAEDYKVFTSEEYGFSMKYPANWVKIDNPKGNYYVVFQAPDLVDGFRNRIHVAAHKPVKDPLNVFLQELRNGIKDLQGKAEKKDKQEVRIVDEGEFRSEVPRRVPLFIQALENKLKIWMDIVIVFYKHDQTLLRISCLAPSKNMEKSHQMFNDVLVSVKFTEGKPETRPSAPQAVPAPTPGAPTQPPVQPGPSGSHDSSTSAATHSSSFGYSSAPSSTGSALYSA